MDSLVQQLTDSPILLAVALVLVAVVVYALVKRLVKLVLFLLVLLAVYIGYLVMTEQEKEIGGLKDKANELIEELPGEFQKGKEFFEEVAEEIKDDLTPAD